MSRAGTKNARVSTFAITNRVIVKLIVNDAGDTGRKLFIFKGNLLLYLTLIRDGEEYVESYADHSHCGCVLTFREAKDGINACNFLKWAHCFVFDIVRGNIVKSAIVTDFTCRSNFKT